MSNKLCQDDDVSGSEIFCTLPGDAEANAETGTSDKINRNDVSAAAIFKEGIFMAALLSAVLIYLAQYELSISHKKDISPCGSLPDWKRGCGSCFLGYDFIGVREATCSAA